jgi:hypothetical protein
MTASISLDTVHFTTDGIRAICTTRAVHLAFDPTDPSISCDKCRLWLAGYRAGKADR